MSAAAVDVVLGLSTARAGASPRHAAAAYAQANDRLWPGPAADGAGRLPGANDDAPPVGPGAGPGSSDAASVEGLAEGGDWYGSAVAGARSSAPAPSARAAGGETARLARAIARTPPTRLALGLAGLLGVVALQTAAFMFVLGDRLTVAGAPTFGTEVAGVPGVPPASDPGALLLAHAPPARQGRSAAPGLAEEQAAAAARPADSATAGAREPTPTRTSPSASSGASAGTLPEASPGASPRTSADAALSVATASAPPAAVPAAVAAGTMVAATAASDPDAVVFATSPAGEPAAAPGSGAAALAASLRREPRPRARPWVTRPVPRRATAPAPARAASTLPPAAPAQTATGNAEWLQAQPATHYTLQLVSVTDAANIEGFARRVGGDAEVAHLQIRKQGSLRHVLVQGAYAERAEAERRAATLARRLGVQPWVRRVADVRAELR